jgi:hypothetical protein
VSYCVYAYFREDNTPYYVGMGKPERPYAQHKRGAIDMRPSDISRIVILREHLTRHDALYYEQMEIEKYGLKESGGLLHNLTTGGECPVLSNEVKQKMRRAALGKPKNPQSIQKAVITRRKNGGYIVSASSRSKMSAAAKGKRTGAANPSARSVTAYDRAGNMIGQFNTAREAAEKLHISWSHIPAVCRGRRPHAGGYVFKYTEQT